MLACQAQCMFVLTRPGSSELQASSMPSRHVFGSKDIVTSRRPMSIDMIGANAAAEPVMARAMVERESMSWMKAETGEGMKTQKRNGGNV